LVTKVSKLSKDNIDEVWFKAMAELMDAVVWFKKSGEVLKITESLSRIFKHEKSISIGDNIYQIFPNLITQISGTESSGVVNWEIENSESNFLQSRFTLMPGQKQDSIIVTIHRINHTDSGPSSMDGNDLIVRNNHLEQKVAYRSQELSKTVSKLLTSNKKLENAAIEKSRVAKAFKSTKDKLEVSLEKEKLLGELKTRFVTTASHEFRTPLSKILSSTEICQLLLKQDKPHRISMHLNNITKSVEELTTILEEFLSVSKLEEGKQTVSFQKSSLKMVANEALDIIRPSLKSGQSIELLFENSEMFIDTDAKILTNILINLFSNASKFSKKNSKSICNFMMIGEELEITISDLGIGIPKTDMPHLFGKFFRARNAINIPGTGLGLNITKRLLELINGKIEVQSVLNEGTSFIVKLPLKLKS